MPKFSKTVYIEVEADDEDAAEAAVFTALRDAIEGDGVQYVDLDGPLETLADDEER